MMGPVSPSSTSRLRGIEGLRALAAGAIVLFHVWRYGSPDGQFSLGPFDRLFWHLSLGVTFFFTLSGFLLYRPFASALMRGTQRPDLATYLRNRALRILPAYWVTLLLTGSVLHATYLRSSATDIRLGALTGEPFLFLRNALLLQNYAPGTLLTGIGPAWSIAIEVVFYVALPILALLGSTLASRLSSRRGHRLAALVPPIACFLVGMSGKAVAAWVVPGLGPGTGWIGDWHSVLERSFWVQADLFAFGMALAVVRVDAEDGFLHLARSGAAALALVAVLVAIPTAVLSDWGVLGKYQYDTLMALASALCLAVVVLRIDRRPGASEPSVTRPSRFLRVLESAPLVTTGVISYSLFLWHEPVIRWMGSRGLTVRGPLGFVIDVVLMGGVSWLLAAGTYRLVEKPALTRKRDMRSEHPGGVGRDPAVRASSIEPG
jgi:peptidoglycan/LPS O-acetylase OafA/YrhL